MVQVWKRDVVLFIVSNITVANQEEGVTNPQLHGVLAVIIRRRNNFFLITKHHSLNGGELCSPQPF